MNSRISKKKHKHKTQTKQTCKMSRRVSCQFSPVKSQGLSNSKIYIAHAFWKLCAYMDACSVGVLSQNRYCSCSLFFLKKRQGPAAPFAIVPSLFAPHHEMWTPAPPCPTQGKMSQKIFNTWYAPESIGMVFIGHLLNKNVKHSWVPHRRNWGTSAPCRTVIDHRCTIVHLWSTTGTLWRSTEHKFSRKKCN